MSVLPRRPLHELVHEIIDVTLSPDLADGPKTNRYAFQVGTALSRSRANGTPQLSLAADEHLRRDR